MKTLKFVLAALIAVSASVHAQPKTWKIDNAHSSVAFSVTHLVISEVEGNFRKFDGSVTASKPDFTDAKIELTVEVSSINTDNDQRDNHLKSADFFDAAQYPQIKFVSKSLTKAGGNKYKLKGDFTMKGVTKPVVLDVVYGGTAKDPWGNVRAGFKISGALNRFDYGLKWNQLVEAGGAMVGKDVKLNCKVELIQSK